MTLNYGRAAAYAGPALPLAVIIFPAYAILPVFYAEHTAIPVATIGLVLIIARVFDAVVDPLIGYWCDVVAGSWGSRKPWLVVGALLLAVATPMLYLPAHDVGAGYYLGWFLAFYLGYSLLEVPHKAWGTDLTSDYAQRSLLATALAVAFAIGTLTFATVPFLAGSGPKAYDANSLSLVAWGFVAVLPVTVVTALLVVPAGRIVLAPKSRPLLMLRQAASNQPLLWYLGIFVLTGLGQGFFYGLVYLLLTAVMPFRDQFAWFLLVDAICTLSSLPLWYLCATRLDKHRAWALGTGLSAVALALLMAVAPDPGSYEIVLALVALRAVGGAVVYVAPNALLGDVVDYELYRRKANRAANFHALVSLATKTTAAVGGGAGLVLIGWAGFTAQAPPDASTGLAVRTVALLVPATILCGASAMAWAFPLDRRRHLIVTRALARRQRRAK